MTLGLIVLSLVFFGTPIIAIILIVLYNTTKEKNKIMEIKNFEEVQGNLERLLDAIKSSDIEKIGIIRDDQLCAVILSINEYERLKHLEECYDIHCQILNKKEK